MKLHFLILFFLTGFNLFIHSQAITNKEIFFSIGMGEIDVEKFSPNENLDFINYVDNDLEFTDFMVFKLGYKFDFFSKMSADIKLIMMDDLIPDNYDISAHYFARPWLGLGAGSMLNKNTITYFEEYQEQTLPNYYLTDENVQQFSYYDLGFYLSPALKLINSDVLKVQIKCDLGISSFNKQGAIFYHKKKLSNEKLLYKYETKRSYQPYVQPKFDARLKAFTIKETSFGLLLNFNYFYSRRSINYSRSIQTWTSENEIKDYVEPPKHKFSRFEFNTGIYLKW